jgi:predicted DNA-binding protein YlxM (UPF0122 family)
MEPIQLRDILKDMKKLEQKDIDDYLLHSQALHYAAAKNIPVEMRRMLRKDIPTRPEKSNFRSVSRMLGDGYFHNEPAYSEDTVMEQLGIEFDLTGKEDDIDDIATQCDFFWKQYCDAGVAFLEQNYVEYRQILASLKPSTPALSLQVQPEETVSKVAVAVTPTLIEAWGEFIKFKSSWNDKIRKTNEKYFEVIEIVLGKNTPVAEVSKQDIRRLMETVERLPKQNKKPYNKMTIQECLDLDEISEDDLVSRKTVKDYLKLCQSFFSAFLTKEKDILLSSPTENVQFEFKSRSYGPYTSIEMKRLVQLFSSETGWRKWVFLLLAYTGADLLPVD